MVTTPKYQVYYKHCYLHSPSITAGYGEKKVTKKKNPPCLQQDEERIEDSGLVPEVLNNRVMHDPSIKPMERALIGQELNDNDNESIKLMKILQNHSIPVVAEKELYEWAIKSKRLNLFSWTKVNLIQTRSRVMKDIDTTVPWIEGDGFEPHLINWFYKKSIGADVTGCKQIYVWSFQKALHSLLTNVTLPQLLLLFFAFGLNQLNSQFQKEINRLTVASLLKLAKEEDNGRSTLHDEKQSDSRSSIDSTTDDDFNEFSLPHHVTGTSYLIGNGFSSILRTRWYHSGPLSPSIDRDIPLTKETIRQEIFDQLDYGRRVAKTAPTYATENLNGETAATNSFCSLLFKPSNRLYPREAANLPPVIARHLSYTRQPDPFLLRTALVIHTITIFVARMAPLPSFVMSTSDLAPLFPSFDQALATFLHDSFDVPQESHSTLCEALINSQYRTWSDFLFIEAIDDLEYHDGSARVPLTRHVQLQLQRFVDFGRRLTEQGLDWEEREHYTKKAFKEYYHGMVTARRAPTADGERSTPPMPSAAPELTHAPAHSTRSTLAVHNSPPTTACNTAGHPTVDNPETPTGLPGSSHPRSTADSTSTGTSSYTWKYSPSTDSVRFRRITYSSTPSIVPADISTEDVPSKRHREPHSTRNRESHSTRARPSSPSPTNSRWAFYPQSETVVFHRARSAPQPSCNSSLQLPPSGASSKDSVVSSSVRKPLYGASFYPVGKPLYDAHPMTHVLPAVCITKRHRDAIKIKLYQLHATPLIATWLYDDVT
eukprot:jgi/Psemu1/19069/gm1.19069_g